MEFMMSSFAFKDLDLFLLQIKTYKAYLGMYAYVCACLSVGIVCVTSH